MKGNIQSIFNVLSFSFKSNTLIFFFKDQFRSLNNNGIIDILTFRNCFAIPFIITDKIFNAMKRNKIDAVLNEVEFVKGMTYLYSRDYLKRLKFIFSILDYNKDGLINKNDVESFMLHFHLMSNKGDVNTLFDTVNQMFKDKTKLTYSEAFEVGKTKSTDAILLLLSYFHVYAPFKDIAIEFYANISGIDTDEEKEPGICCQLERKASQPNTTMTFHAISTITNYKPANSCSFGKLKSNKGTSKDPEPILFTPSIFVYDYLKLNFNEEYPDLDSLITEETSASDDINELNELNTFEEDMNSVKALISSLKTNTLIKSFICSNEFSAIKNSNILGNDFCSQITNESTRKFSSNSEGIPQKSTFLSLDKLDKQFQSPMEPKKSLSAHNNAYFSDKCMYQDSIGNKYPANITIIGNMIFIYRKKDFSKEENEKLDITKTLLLKKVYVDDKEDELACNCTWIVKGLIEKYTFTFDSKSIATECMRVINNITNMRDINNEYLIGGKIGLGTNGVVKRVQNKITNEYYAIKILPINYNDRPDIQLINEELDVCKLLCRVSHDNILKVYDYFETPYFSCIIMEFIQGSTLGSFIEAKPSLFQENKYVIVDQLINSLSVLHYYGIIHRDLKPDNVMIITKPKEIQLKLIDFGFSKVICKGELVKQPLGTILYASPEMLLNKHYNDTIDLWSLGIILYQFVYEGNHPFCHKGNGNDTIINNIIGEEIDIQIGCRFNQLDKTIVYIMRRCFERDSKKRISVIEVLNMWKNMKI